MKRLINLLLFCICACSVDKEPATDFALVANKDAWLRHPVIGDPSFDNFTRYQKNPIQRGTPPYNWPVNGYYFEDPVSGNEYLYIGQYHTGYVINPGKPVEISEGCIFYFSEDKGITWKYGGPVFNDEEIVLEGESGPIKIAPDVSVVFTDGMYYMGFDYATTKYSWDFEHIMHGGLAVAVSDKPGGPYKIFKKPAISCRYFYNNPWFGKYSRCYGGTLLKTKTQWIFLFDLDSRTYYSWGLAAISAPTPEGPWSKPVLIAGCEKKGYYPSLLEYYPAFIEDDTIYAPATSVARNRDFQCIFRVPAADAMNPEKWELWREGSVWHSTPAENEYEGIWGQTLSGFITKDHMFKVMFPSKDKENRGTINLASADWNRPYRGAGFVLSGHSAPSFTAITGFYNQPGIKASFTYYGTVAFTWDYQAPAGPNFPRADAELNPLMYSSNTMIQLTDDHCFLIHTSRDGQMDTLSRGMLKKHEFNTLKVESHKQEIFLSINDEELWHGKLEDTCYGHCGLFAMSHSGMDVRSFIVSGKSRSGYFDWLFTEGLCNSGSNLKDWDILENNTLFSYCLGAVSKIDTTMAKWSFTGSGFDLFCPKMPVLGRAQIIVNGETKGEIDLYAKSPEKSNVVFSVRDLPQKKNAVIIKGVNGKIALDCLRVYE
jgi:hypothetical protein